MELRKLIVLAMLAAGPVRADDGLYLQLIFDASGSMAGQIGGETKINAARRAIGYLIDSLPEGDASVNVGFRVFGHEGDNTDRGRSASCRSSDLKVPMEAVNPWKLHAEAAAYQPTGWTPITLALTQAGGDFAVKSGRRNVIVLVTDGEETCFGDPCGAASMLSDSDAAVVAHVIGFGLDPKVAKNLQCIAANTGGAYVDATDGNALAGLMLGLVGEEVRHAGGEVRPVELPAGVAVPAVTIDERGVRVAELIGVSGAGVNVADAIKVTGEGVNVADTIKVTGEGVDVAGIKVAGPPGTPQATGAIESRLVGTWRSAAPIVVELVFNPDGTGWRTAELLGAGARETGRWRVASARDDQAIVHLSEDGFDTYEIWTFSFTGPDRFSATDPLVGVELIFAKIAGSAERAAARAERTAAQAQGTAARAEEAAAAGERTAAEAESLGAQLEALGESLGSLGESIGDTGERMDPDRAEGGAFGDVLSVSQSVAGSVIHCAPNGDCGCGDGAKCIFHCDGGNCDFECGEDSECVFHCDGGNCDGECGEGSRCIMQCAFNCDMDCGDGARCRLDD